MRILLVGHGRMGRLVESLASSYGCTIAGVVTGREGIRALESTKADVAIDFSVGAAVPSTLSRLASRRMNVVIGTTGWQAEEQKCRQIASAAGIGVIASANFAVSVYLFRKVVADAASRFGALADVGAYIHESHHAAKKDAPSGTAHLLEQAMKAAGYPRPIDVSSTRAGSIPGTHTVGFEGPSDSVTMTHTVRDRAVFARGALEAAKWVNGRTGWFSVEDML